MAAELAKSIFIDLRLAHMIIATVLFLVAYLIPDFAGSLAWDSIVPLKMEVIAKNGSKFTVVGTLANPAFSYPLKDEQVSTSMLAIFSAVVPISLIIISTLISFFSQRSQENKTVPEKDQPEPPRVACTTWPAFRIGVRIMDGFSGTLESTGITLLISETLKLACGRPRPNYQFMHDEEPVDALSSFPSAHASVGFCGLTYAALVLWHDLGSPLMKQPNLHVLILPMVLVCTSPMWLAGWISVTRVQDHYHHSYDVTAGALIGIACAMMIFYIHKSVSSSRQAPVKSVQVPANDSQV